jgi:hypothetical protein
MTPGHSRRVWYVAYASNLALDRFRCYLGGGPIRGGRRDYPGCRSGADPQASARLQLDGRLVFAGRSTVWGGGVAVHDPRSAGRVAGRGYLLTCDQAADVVAQEVRQPPGGAWARAAERQIAEGSDHIPTSGAGLYDTLLLLGERDGIPMFTLAREGAASLTLASPTAAYLRWFVAGLVETYGWDGDRVSRYLMGVPGIGVGWTPAAIGALAGRPSGHPGSRPGA